MLGCNTFKKPLNEIKWQLEHTFNCILGSLSVCPTVAWRAPLPVIKLRERSMSQKIMVGVNSGIWTTQQVNNIQV